MATKPNIAELVSQMPEVDKPGEASTFTGPNPKDAEKTFAEIFAGGRESVLDLIALVKAPGDEGFESYRAGYVVHGLAVHAGKPGNEKQRSVLTEALAGQLASDKHSKQAKAFFLQELQVCGGPDAVDALAKVIGDEELGDPAIRALVSIGPGAVEALRAALGRVSGRNRVGVMLALGRLGDAASVGALKDTLGGADAEVRLAAAWALANQGDVGSASSILKLADDASGWERIQATKACLLLAEKLAESGKRAEAARIYTRLRDTRTDESEKYLRDAAELGLAAARSLG
jgi:HEAT repeat protein